MNPAPPTTQKISAALALAAQQALGGPPTRPPALPTQAISLVPENPNHSNALATRQDAFAQFQAAPAPLPEPPAAIGHPTFDTPAAAVLLLRDQVAALRSRLGSLARLILTENEALQPLLSELDFPTALAAEHFDAALARDFLARLSQTVQALATPAEPSEPAKIS